MKPEDGQPKGKGFRRSSIDKDDDLVPPCEHGKHLFMFSPTEDYAICGICQCTVEIRLGDVRDRFGRLLEEGR